MNVQRRDRQPSTGGGGRGGGIRAAPRHDCGSVLLPSTCMGDPRHAHARTRTPGASRPGHPPPPHPTQPRRPQRPANVPMLGVCDDSRWSTPAVITAIASRCFHFAMMPPLAGLSSEMTGENASNTETCERDARRGEAGSTSHPAPQPTAPIRGRVGTWAGTCPTQPNSPRSPTFPSHKRRHGPPCRARPCREPGPPPRPGLSSGCAPGPQLHRTPG
jgi:hypothetical protein